MSSSRLTTAFQSVSSQISSVIQTGKLGKTGDAKLFNSGRKGELSELKTQLASAQKDRKKAAVKKVIAAMTLGKDVSSLFPEVVNCMQTTNLELKKLVYLYIINFARTRPELAVLAINTFRKDTMDPNPLVRALAIRTMGCIKLEQMVEYLVEPLNRLCRDADPYVRKTAAICVAKLYGISPQAAEENGFINLLQSMMTDTNPMTVVNVISTLAEISSRSERNLLEFSPSVVNKLLISLGDCSEWGQIMVMDAIVAYYEPANEREAAVMIDRLTSRLNHANPAVVLTCVRLLVKLCAICHNEQILQQRVVPPLLSLLASDCYESQFVVLRNLQLLVQKYPSLLNNECRMFFVKFNDPTYVKFEKLDLLVRCAHPANVELLVAEFTEYAQEVDIEFVRRSVRALGRLAMAVPGSVANCLRALTAVMDSRAAYVVEEGVLVISDLLRKYPGEYESVLNTIIPIAVKTVEDQDAKAGLVWMLGEYCDKISNVEQILQERVAGFVEEPLVVQMQILTAVMKLYMQFPTAGQQMVFHVLKFSTEEVDNPDLRDRAYIYWRMLTTDPAMAKEVICSAKPKANIEAASIDKGLLDKLVNELGSLASIYHEPQEIYWASPRPGLLDRADENEGSDDYAEEELAAETNSKPERKPSLDDTDEDSDDAVRRSDPNSSDENEEPPASPAAVPAVTSPAQPRPIPPRQIFLPASPASNGVQLEGCVTRLHGSPMLLLRVMNVGSNTALRNVQIQLLPNSFGFQQQQETLASGPISKGNHQDVGVRLSAGIILNKQPPTNPPNFQAIVRVESMDPVQIIVPFDIINVLIEKEAVDKEIYRQHWLRIGTQKAEQFMSIHNSGQPLGVEVAKKQLTMYNIMTVTETAVPTHSTIYCSAITLNKLLVLVEVTLQQGGPGVRVAMRCDVPILFGPLADSICKILGVTPSRPATPSAA